MTRDFPAYRHRAMLSAAPRDVPPPPQPVAMVAPVPRPSIGERLARLREERGLTQEELAYRTALRASAEDGAERVSIGRIRQLEQDRTATATNPTIRALADALGVSTDELC